MESFNSWSKGLHNEYLPISQPDGTYRRALNAIRRTDGTLYNESGTIVTANIATGLEVIGSFVLENDIILFQTDGTNNEIGVLNGSDTYTVITQSPLLNFSLSKQIDVQGKKNSKGERVLQFTDDGENPPRYLNLDDLELSNLNVFFTYDIPTIDLVSVNETGSLPTGIYQFAARLLTSTTNATAFGFISGIVPIVDDIKSSGRDNYDGAPPQTAASKSITISVNNISTSFDFVEIAAITYSGTSNQFDGNIIARIPIQGRTSIEFTYNSLSQKRLDGEITLNELVQEFPNYIGAKCLEQKDGRYFYSNLQAAKTEVDFQLVANNILVKYVIDEVLVPVEDIQIDFRTDTTNFDGNLHQALTDGIDQGTSSNSYNDYKNEKLTFNKKGLMRGERYSFSIAPVFKNGSVGFAYHIPGNNKITSTTTAADFFTNELGTFVSTSSYPDGFGYPTGNIRHHVMPTLSQEPHFLLDGSNYKIRILGIELSNIDLTVLGADADLIVGWIIGRELRTDDNKSILTQGIAQNLVSKYNTTSPYTKFFVSPVTGKYPWFSPDQTPASTTQSEEMGASLVAFYSPESVLLQREFSGVTGIKTALRVSGVQTAAWFEVGATNRNSKYWNSFINYTTAENFPLSEDEVSIEPSTLQYVPADPGLSDLNTFAPSGTSIEIYTKDNNGFLFFKIVDGSVLPIENPLLTTRPEFMYWDDTGGTSDRIYLHDIGETGSYQFGNAAVHPSANVIQGSSNRLIYNLTSSKPSQYGEIYDAKYIFMGYNNKTTSPVTHYNGDTFISKCELVSKTRAFEGVNNLDVKFITSNYIWLESSINTNYRHYVAAFGNTAGTIPYYPKSKKFAQGDGTGMFEVPAAIGHSTGYNKQYSFENNFKYYYPQQLGVGIVEEFPNRTIYSEQSVEGEQFDANRLFLPNNYHDIPKNKGEIIDTFVFNKVLYLHTSQSLWRTSINERSALVSDVGSVYTGSGGLFPSPSEEVMTVSGGYAGTTSQWAGCSTPFGRFFVDNIQGKVFLMTNEILEISDPSLSKYFHDNLQVEVDNPTLRSGWISVFDYTNKRWLLTNTDSESPITLSYSPELESWSSWHSYTPNHYVSRGNRFFGTKESTYKLWEFNKGNKGDYFNSQYNFEVDFVINVGPNTTKSLDNLVLYTNSINTTGKEIYLDTFDNIQVYNEFRNTGEYEINTTRGYKVPISDRFTIIKADYVNNEFRIAIPRDLVIDQTQDLFSPSNLNTSPLNTDARARMKGKYFIVKLVYNNTDNNELNLNLVKSIMRETIR